MTEYDLVCDRCGKPLEPPDGVVSWTVSNAAEGGFSLTHDACVPDAANARIAVRMLVLPNEFLAFVGERFGRPIAEPDPLRAIVWALAPFVMRHDSAAEMDAWRAASFGATPGVKPGTAGAPPKAALKEVEAGK